MKRPSPLLRLGELTQDQWGLVTRGQLEDAGFASTTVERLTSSGGTLERVSWGVYQLVGSPIPDHRDLRGAWLQLAPHVHAWERTPDQGVVSHRSAAAVYELGHLPADQHEFTVPVRRQTRRPDVRIHLRQIHDGEWASLDGLLLTRPPRIASDLLRSREDPEAIAHVVADALRRGHATPGEFVSVFGRGAAASGFRRGDGMAVFRWLLDLAGDMDSGKWISQVRVDKGAGP